MMKSMLVFVYLLCVAASGVAGDITDYGTALFGDPMSPTEARLFFSDFNAINASQLDSSDVLESLSMIAHTVIEYDPDGNDLLDSLLSFNMNTTSQQLSKLQVLSEFTDSTIRDTIYSYLNDDTDDLRIIAARYAFNVYQDTTSAMPVIRELGARGLDVLAMVSPTYWASSRGTFTSVVIDTVPFSRKMLAARMLDDSTVLDSLFRAELAAANPNDNTRLAKVDKLNMLDGALRHDLQSTLPDVVALLADVSTTVGERAAWVLYEWAGDGNSSALAALEEAAVNTQFSEYVREVCQKHLDRLAD